MGGLLLRPCSEAPEAIELEKLRAKPHPLAKHLA